MSDELEVIRRQIINIGITSSLHAPHCNDIKKDKK